MQSLAVARHIREGLQDASFLRVWRAGRAGRDLTVARTLAASLASLIWQSPLPAARTREKMATTRIDILSCELLDRRQKASDDNVERLIDLRLWRVTVCLVRAVRSLRKKRFG